MAMPEHLQRFVRDEHHILRWGDLGTQYTYDPDDADSITKALQHAVAQGLARQGAEGMDDFERSIAVDIQGRVGIRKDAQDSLMVAWYPDPDTATAIAALCPGGEAPSDLHLTLLYLGDPDADGSGPWDTQLVAAVCKLFSRRFSPLEGTVTGIGRFVGEGDQDVLIALMDIPGLEDFRRCLRDELLCQGSVPPNSPIFSQEHGFVPHITLAYVPKGQSTTMTALTEPMEVELDNLTFAVGADRATFSLGYMTGENVSETVEAAPFYASRYTEEIAKAGKVLSAKNLADLQAAHDAMGKVIERGLAAMKKEEDAAGVAKSDPETVADAITYAITKKKDEKRYTLGPLYAPNRKDAHGEWVEDDTLQEALWGYVRESSASGRRLNIQHGDLGAVTVGEWVEAMAWPQEVTVELQVPGGEVQKHTFPAGTTWMGIVWDEEAWPLVKSGKLGGLSMGGRAVRLADGDLESLESMGWKTTKSAVTAEEGTNGTTE
jgi:2'-5' RNA ligase